MIFILSLFISDPHHTQSQYENYRKFPQEYCLTTIVDNINTLLDHNNCLPGQT